MKKKLSVNTLALGNLKARKKQYTIMIIGIILAMVFSSGIVFFISSFSSSLAKMNEESFGKAQNIILNLDEDNVEKIKESGFADKIGLAHTIGYGYTENDYEGTVIAWLDDTAMELANPILLEGTYPTKENEIAIESMTLAKLGIKAKAGDTITLNVKTQDGKTTFDKAESKSYKLTGILKNKKSNFNYSDEFLSDFPSAFVAAGTQTELGGKETLGIYMTRKDGVKMVGKFNDFLEDNNLNQNDFHISSTEILYSNGNVEPYNMQLTLMFIGVIVAVLMIASLVGVITAFNSNLKERKKQIGLLRAVGTTKRQIVNIFGREAFIITLIATPISIAISYIAVYALLKFLGDSFVFVLNVPALLGSAAFSIASVMIATLIPLVSASRITPMQAIRNIETTRRQSRKHIKSKKSFDVSSLLAKRSMTFGKGKQIAVSLLLIVSILSAGYAFSWYSYEKDQLFELDSDYELSLYSDGGYAIGVNFKSNNNGFSENDRQALFTNTYIDTVYGAKQAYTNLLVPFSTSDYRKLLNDRYTYKGYDNVDSKEKEEAYWKSINSENYEEMLFSELHDNADDKKMQQLVGTNEYMSVDLVAYDTAIIEKLSKSVYDGKINIEKLNSGEEIILNAPKKAGMYMDDIGSYERLVNCWGNDVDKYDCIFSDECDFKAGERVPVATLLADAPLTESENESTSGDWTVVPDDTQVNKSEVTIAALTNGDGMPGGYGFSPYNLTVVTTIQGLEHFIEGRKYKSLIAGLNRPCTDEIDKNVQETTHDITQNIQSARCVSAFAFQNEQKQETERIFIGIIAIVILFFTVCLAIINNTITTSIRESKREIGTIRAVGASQGVLVSAYIKQLLSMLAWGTGAGVALFGISFLGLFIVYKIKDANLRYVFNPIGLIVFCIIGFAVCSVNLWLRIKKETKNSIIDNIREL